MGLTLLGLFYQYIKSYRSQKRGEKRRGEGERRGDREGKEGSRAGVAQVGRKEKGYSPPAHEAGNGNTPISSLGVGTYLIICHKIKTRKMSNKKIN